MNTEKQKPGIFKKTRAAMCHYCPFCMHARKNPESVIGKILHKPAHADNCPLWTAEKDVYGRE